MMPKAVKRFSDDIMVHLVDFAAYMRRQVIPLGCKNAPGGKQL
jgi:hypothetical protein